MRPWTRLQDWGTLLAGAYTITSPKGRHTIGMAGEGNVVVSMITHGATTAFGVLLFIAPWVVGYAGLTGPAWTSWVVGVLVVVVSQTVVRPFNRAPRHAIQH